MSSPLRASSSQQVNEVIGQALSTPKPYPLPPDVLAWIESGQRWDPLEEIAWRLGAEREEGVERRAEITVGREEEIKSIHKLLERGRHVLLVGSHGVGKSHMLRHIAGELAGGGTCLFFDGFGAPKSVLKEVCLALHEAGHLPGYQHEADPERAGAMLNRLPLGNLSQLAAAGLDGQGYTLVIDNLDSLTAAGVPILQAISDKAILVAACKAEKTERVAGVIDRFNRVELAPMNSRDIAALLWTRLERAAVADPQLLERRIVAQANGNPGVVVDAAHKLAGNASLADIRDVRATIPTTSQVDLTWIVFFAVAGLLALRYVARATDSTTAYVVFGVLSAFGMAARILLPRLARY
ncbi:MAG: ATP-binding protein [Thermoflexales bacterium]|nr:ATP-binding protein [Thermoflexales bacterium]